MPLIRYRDINFHPTTLRVIEQANQIASGYASQGFSLTLRQLYYRFVAGGLIENNQRAYKRLGTIINKARYAGLFDWSDIEDRTRSATIGDSGATEPGHPERTIDPDYFYVSQWDGQPHRIEVWVEKDALIDVVQQASGGLRVTSLSCRGYTSAPTIWAAAQRVEDLLDEPSVERVTVLHLGDHDPSGIDMSRDITDRLKEFVRGDTGSDGRVTIKRIALNMPQINQYNPPPNPAKTTDSRYASYIDRFGPESWELDALDPAILVNLIRSEVQPLIDTEKWQARSRLTAEGREVLRSIRDNYDEVLRFLRDNDLLAEIE